MLNKDTKLFGSFSDNPGNNGCIFFNDAFKKHNIDAIYKSFYSVDIEKTIVSIKHLNFSGFALSMPLKKQVYNFLDVIDDDVKEIGAANTVLNDNGRLIGFNTDWIGVYRYFSTKTFNKVNVLGNGGFASAIIYALKKLNIEYEVYDRSRINEIEKVKNEIFINATPVDFVMVDNLLIDARPFTEVGKEIFTYQAMEQFKIYTGIEYE